MLEVVVVGPLAVVQLAVLVALFRERRQARKATSPADWLERVAGERVLVHCTDDNTLDGVLVETLGDGLLLRAVRSGGERPVELAGDLFVPRARVALVQYVRAVT